MTCNVCNLLAPTKTLVHISQQTVTFNSAFNCIYSNARRGYFLKFDSYICEVI
jgi:hypothetical protein